MKKTRLLEIIREEIAGALREDEAAEKAAKDAQVKATDLEIKALQKKKAELMKTGVAEVTLEEDTLNEVPDFGGQLDQGVAAKYGEEDTLQKAVDEIVDETLKDMGITLEDLKKDKDKATEALTSIREKVLGAKRKNIPQDSRVIKALKKQEDIEVDKLGSISGKSLQQNQTDNAIKKALGLVTPGKKGRKADPNKAEKPAKEKAPKAEKTSKSEPMDDEDKEAAKAAGSDKTAKELGSTPEEKKVKFNQFLASVKKNKEDKAKIDGILKLAKDKFKFPKTMMDDLKRAAGRDVEA
jgi:hypothetical protein